jgi:hypothetical protein
VAGEHTADRLDAEHLLELVDERYERFDGRSCEMLGVDVTVRAKLEPLRGRLVRLVDRGWLRKLPDGRFTTRL